MPKRKVALIGTGRWGNILKPHIEKHFDLVETTATQTYRDILKEREIDTVFIATPIRTHYKVAKEALEAGKHIFLEKPITKVVEEAEELKIIAQEKGLNLYVDYQMQQSPTIKFIKDQKLGKLRYAFCCGNRNIEKPKENIHWLLTSHILSYIDMFKNIEDFKFRSIYSDLDGNLAKDVLINQHATIMVNSDEDPTYEFILYFDEGKIEFQHGAEDNVKFAKHILSPCSHFKSEPFAEDKETFGISYLDDSVKKFKDILEGKTKSNIDSAIRVTKVIEKLMKGKNG